MAEVTKGPWTVNEDGFMVESEKEHGWANDGWVVCATYGPDREANAYLLAAAPVMYEALTMADAVFRDLGWHDKYEVTSAALKVANNLVETRT